MSCNGRRAGWRCCKTRCLTRSMDEWNLRVIKFDLRYSPKEDVGGKMGKKGKTRRLAFLRLRVRRVVRSWGLDSPRSTSRCKGNCKGRKATESVQDDTRHRIAPTNTSTGIGERVTRFGRFLRSRLVASRCFDHAFGLSSQLSALNFQLSARVSSSSIVGGGKM
jgi:hypothetical protein